MKCYVGDEEATRKAIDKDGWLDTGDGAALDEEGFLYIKDRLKDIIIRGGENIPSSDVENALYAHPGVAEAAAVGIPDPILGEVVGSVVSLHPQSSARPDEAELLGVVRPLLSRRAVPVIVVVHPEPLPRNVNGKIVKGDLRRIVADAWEARRARQLRAKL
uniref:LuxE n=1 Tax=Tremella fuciformis TaxID=64657 RepID=D5KY57_9TREE|nr:LuxE [Tremella fuciformis]